MGKVLELMDALAAKITADGEAEAKAYREFVEWCDDASKNAQFAIKTATAKQASLEAEISKCIGTAGAAAAAIEELAASIGTDEADLAAATKIRNKEGADFAKGEAELLDAIDTLSRAITIISREMAKNPASFAQIDTTSMSALLSSLSAVVDAASFSGEDKGKLLALVQSREATDGDDYQEPGAPAASVYKSHSGNIVDVLEDMKEKAEEQLSALRKAELTAKHNYDMLKQSLEDQLAQSNKDMAAQKATQASADGAKATAEGDLAATVKDLAQSKDNLQTTNGECMSTAADHEATVRSRTEELAVIAQAKKILQETTGGAVEQSYSFLQLQGTSRLFARSDLANAEVVAMVKKLAHDHHSSALAQLASRIASVMKFGTSAGQDPFAKVKGLISDLISKLETEAEADATEKAYCDEQIAKTTEKKNELDAAISKLTTKIDNAAAASATLKEEVSELQSELAALARTQAEMDKVRADEHASYSKAKADLEQGLQGVRNALSVLREYYGGAALLQSGADMSAMMAQPAVPEHAKATGAGQGIIDILEVCESDFAKNLAEEETEESDAAGTYERVSQENAITKTNKEQDVKYKTQEFTGLDKEIAELSSDRETEGTELAAVMEYFAKIKDRCIAKPETYEERKRRREAEIAGLKEALRVLDEETAFIQKTKRNLRNHRALSL